MAICIEYDCNLGLDQLLQAMAYQFRDQFSGVFAIQ